MSRGAFDRICRRVRGSTRVKKADQLRDRLGCSPERLQRSSGKSRESAVTALFPRSTVKNDRCRKVRLSKIAHKTESSEGERFRSRSVSTADLLQPRCADFGDAVPISSVCIRQSEFVSTIQADLVRPALDREHAAYVTVMTAERELDCPVQRVHRSSLLRSQLPFTSSQFSNVVTLALASAIAQSAAP